MYQRKKNLFDQVVLHVKDINRSKRFYRAVVESLGHTITQEFSERFFIDELEIRQNDEPSKFVQLAFHAENPASVNLFLETAIQYGGKCVAAPECTELGTYSANVTDPDGNTICAVFKRSSQKNVSISF